MGPHQRRRTSREDKELVIADIAGTGKPWSYIAGTQAQSLAIHNAAWGTPSMVHQQPYRQRVDGQCRVGNRDASVQTIYSPT